MKRLMLVMVLVMGLATCVFADFSWMQMNLVQGYDVADGWASPYNDPYFEIEGGGRSGVLDLYYFFDVNHFMGAGDNSNGDQGSFYTIVTPKFEVMKNYFIATKYRGYNGGENYYLGLSTTPPVPFLDVFYIDAYTMFQNVDNGNDKTMLKYAGILTSVIWNAKLATLDDNTNITYGGYADYTFDNKYAEDFGAPSTSDEFQMYNAFYLNRDKWSISTNVKFHYHFMFSEANSHDKVSYFVGLHRKF